MKAVCVFKQKTQKLTVGDVFEMHCQWPKSIELSPPVRVGFPNIKEGQRLPTPIISSGAISPHYKPYSLYILKTINISSGEGVFEVTSYQPGHYEGGFDLVSSTESLPVKPISWKVESVIPKEQASSIQPAPPYGPWTQPLPFWYGLIGPALILGLLGWLVFKLYFFIHRKALVKKILARIKDKNPFREIIYQVQTLETELSVAKKEETNNIIKQLDYYFRLFLENQFFIFAADKTAQKILNQMKRHYNYEDNKRYSLFDLFNETEKLSVILVDKSDVEQMLIRARQTACFLVDWAQKNQKGLNS